MPTSDRGINHILKTRVKCAGVDIHQAHGGEIRSLSVTHLDVDVRLGNFVGEVLEAVEGGLELAAHLPEKVAQPRHVRLLGVFLERGLVENFEKTEACSQTSTRRINRRRR